MGIPDDLMQQKKGSIRIPKAQMMVEEETEKSSGLPIIVQSIQMVG